MKGGAARSGSRAGRAPALRDGIARLLQADPPRAAAFIVTLYGDAIVPRGGAVWIGDLIDCCAAIDINESRVRTAVSRLVTAGRLQGDRIGRRSYYRLTATARHEFARAADVLFAPPDQRDGARWHILWLPEGVDPEALAPLDRATIGHIGPRCVILPDGAADALDRQRIGAEPLRLDATIAPRRDSARLRDMAAACWPLASHAAAYERFVQDAVTLAAAVDAGADADDSEALLARLVLVHSFRKVALAEPRLPAAALPTGWPGHAARRLYARLYLALSPSADAFADRFQDAQGSLQPDHGMLAARRDALAAYL